MAVGLTLTLLSFLGFCGAYKVNYCLLVLFSTLLSLILLAGMAAAGIAIIFRTKVDSIADETVRKAVRQYNDTEKAGAKRFLDWVQQELKCCGADGPQDYTFYQECPNKVILSSRLPSSGAVRTCHKSKTCTGSLYETGCQAALVEFFNTNQTVVLAFVLGLVIIVFFGIGFSCILLCDP